MTQHAGIARANAVLTASPRLTEVKHFARGLSANFSSVSTICSTLDLASLITAGTGYDQRVGRSCYIKGLVVEGTLHGGQSNLVTDDNHNTVRIIAVRGVPAVVATSLTASFTLSYAPINGETLSGVKEVLFDQQYELPSAGPDSTGYMPSIKHVKTYIPINRYFTYYSGGPSDDTVFLSMVSDSTAVSHPGFVSGWLDVLFADN